jgi:hypothetical protein
MQIEKPVSCCEHVLHNCVVITMKATIKKTMMKITTTKLIALNTYLFQVCGKVFKKPKKTILLLWGKRDLMHTTCSWMNRFGHDFSTGS